MYNNPNFYNFQSMSRKPSFFNNIRNLNFNALLNSTQKTLNIINQAIPIFYQIKPLWENTKTIFRIAGAINSNDNKEEPKLKIKEIKIKKDEEDTTNNLNTKQEINNSIKKEKDHSYNEPVFFL